MIGQVNETAYDLRFVLFGIPVRIHPAFWLVAVIMGGNLLRDPNGNGVPFLAIWVAVMFVSILVHELGHALAAKYYRWPPHIVLYHFGGYAAYNPTWGNSPQRTMVVLIAGPGAGFLLFGLVFGIRHWLEESGNASSIFVRMTLYQLEYINLWWGVLNLLPVLPLDGGQLCQQICKLMRFRDWLEISLKVSMIVSGAAALYFLQQRLQYAGFLFGFLCFSNFQMFQSLRGRGGGGGYW